MTSPALSARKTLIVGYGANAVRVADDEHLRVGVLAESLGELPEILPRGRHELIRVEREEQPRRERHMNALTDALDFGALDLLDLSCLPVHLTADQRASRAAHHGSDYGPARRGATRSAGYTRSGGCTDTRAHDGTLLRVGQARTAAEGERAESQRDYRPRAKLICC